MPVHLLFSCTNYPNLEKFVTFAELSESQDLSPNLEFAKGLPHH